MKLSQWLLCSKLAERDIEKLRACRVKTCLMQEALVPLEEKPSILLMMHNQIMYSVFCLFQTLNIVT